MNKKLGYVLSLATFLSGYTSLVAVEFPKLNETTYDLTTCVRSPDATCARVGFKQEGNDLKIPANFRLSVGDPAPKQPKKLIIVYEKGGTMRFDDDLDKEQVATIRSPKTGENAVIGMYYGTHYKDKDSKIVKN